MLKSSDSRGFWLGLNMKIFLTQSILKHSFLSHLPLFLLCSLLKNFRGAGSWERIRLGFGSSQLPWQQCCGYLLPVVKGGISNITMIYLLSSTSPENIQASSMYTLPVTETSTLQSFSSYLCSLLVNKKSLCVASKVQPPETSISWPSLYSSGLEGNEWIKPIAA